MIPDHPNCILASQSPRRREILENLGISVHVTPTRVDETIFSDRAIETEVRRLAADKLAALSPLPHDTFGLAADTVVVVENCILGKPRDEGEAMAMLEKLSGRWHRVVTGIALAFQGRVLSAHAVTEVEMAPLSAAEIAWYVETGEPMDKAGAYGIQGLGGLFITQIKGSYSNVVGLPIHTLYTLFKTMGLENIIRNRHA